MIVEKLLKHAEQQPEQIALRGDHESLNYAALLERVSGFAHWLNTARVRVLGIALDNSIDWIVADLAGVFEQITVVPIPPFFSEEQVNHLVSTAGVNCLVTSSEGEVVTHLPGSRVAMVNKASESGKQSAKITFTSGSTGLPKGVVLGLGEVESVAASIVLAMDQMNVQRHLCVLPLATLLENIAGVYAPLLKGIEVIIPSPEVTGLIGSSSLDIEKFASCLSEHKPHSLIIVPQLLVAMTTLIELGMLSADELRMVAVGGGKISDELLVKAQCQGIPVFEGYGLAEACSVVTLNLPGQSKPGSVGRPLPHAEIRVSHDGELEVRGAVMRGYLGEQVVPEWFPTGDYGSVDEEGYVFIDGRKKNMFITAFGRNVHPEWVEAALTQKPAINQVLFDGEAREENLALIWLRFDMDDESVVQLVQEVNSTLPDYARVHRHLVMTQPLDASLMTGNGRLKRDLALRKYSALINQIYKTKANSTLEGAVANVF